MFIVLKRLHRSEGPREILGINLYREIQTKNVKYQNDTQNVMFSSLRS